MEFASAQWRVRLYRRDSGGQGVPVGGAVYDRRGFVNWGQGSAGSTDISRREEQPSYVVCPYDNVARSGMGVRISSLVHGIATPDSWWNLDTMVPRPVDNTMRLALESSGWTPVGITD